MNLSDEPQKIRELLALRACGWSVLTLSKYYGKDRTSIRHHLAKYDIQPFTAIIKIKIVRPVNPEEEVPKNTEERINPGLSYREYVERAKQRHPEEHYHNLPIGRKKMSDILVDVCQ